MSLDVGYDRCTFFETNYSRAYQLWQIALVFHTGSQKKFNYSFGLGYSVGLFTTIGGGYVAVNSNPVHSLLFINRFTWRVANRVFVGIEFMPSFGTRMGLGNEGLDPSVYCKLLALKVGVQF